MTLQEIKNMAATLHTWKTESRSRDSLVAEIVDVEEAFVYAKALVAEAQGMIGT